MPGIMRLFARVEGCTPFCLILDDNLLPEHYTEIAEKYFRENWRSTRQPPELVLVRRIIFKNNDQLFDFRKKKRATRATIASLIASGVTPAGAPPPPPGTPAAAAPPPAPSVARSTKPTKLFTEASQQAESIRLEMIVTNPPVASLLAHCDSELVVKAITLNRLITKISDQTCSRYLENVFWTTYRTYSDPGEILEKLMERYLATPDLTHAGQPMRSPLDVAYYDEVQESIRLRVVQLIETWVDKYFFDFADDGLHHRLSRFLRDRVDADGVPTIALTLMRQRDRRALGQRKPVVHPGLLNRSLSPTAVLATGDPLSVANQLTLLTLHTHNQIMPHELLGRQWEGAASANVPNFIAYRDFINRVSNWVTYAIVSEKDLAVRTVNLSKMLQCCEHLHSMQNWDALVAVYGGISDPAVSRLTTTIAALPAQDQPLISKFEELLSQRGSSKMLKAAMASSPRPHFPSIVVHLRDLLHLEETPVVVDGMINFLRCSHQYNLVSFLLDGRFATLDILPNPDLQGVFSFWKIVDDRILGALSVECQGR